MIGKEDISQTLKMLHTAAGYEMERRNISKAIEILNNARILEDKMGHKLESAETMLEIADAYILLENYELAMWFAEEAQEIVLSNSKPNLFNKANHLLTSLKQNNMDSLIC